MTSNEKEIFEMMDKQTRHHKIWMPLVWASMVAAQARREGRCPDDYGLKAMIKEITNLRYNCGKLQEYHTMSVPLVYTQVVTMATYSYFAFSILGRQFLDPKQGYDNHSIDFYVPIFTFLQFIFYMGWLKVAESLLNPFGDDDDDFDTNDFLDRHLEISYMIVDVMHKSYPDVLTDPAKEDTSYFNVSTTSPVTDTYNKENLTHKANVVNRSIKGEKCPPVIKYYGDSTAVQDQRATSHRPPSSQSARYNQTAVTVSSRDATTRLSIPPHDDSYWHDHHDTLNQDLGIPRPRPHHYHNGSFLPK
ncbi:Bestrophin-2-like 2 [Homarus americanus]|uniref:Bestrophin homolog n=1 Tax=Homarus americanus TaxID=6706 RepID=A0A8J5K3D5_HOMAM|nr:Bestrophin-2-like 2 [Homarus americanus]